MDSSWGQAWTCATDALRAEALEHWRKGVADLLDGTCPGLTPFLTLSGEEHP